MAKSTVRAHGPPGNAPGLDRPSTARAGRRPRLLNTALHPARPPAAQNHTAHNQSYKNHRNGIKKERVGFSVKGSKPSLKGVSGARRRAKPQVSFCLRSGGAARSSLVAQGADARPRVPPLRLHRRSSLACMCRLTRSSCATKGLRRSTTAKVGTRRPSSRPSLLRSQLAAAELGCARFTGPPWLRWCGALDAGIDDSCGRLWLGGSVSWMRLSLRSHRMRGLAYWAAPHCAVVCDGVPK